MWTLVWCVVLLGSRVDSRTVRRGWEEGDLFEGDIILPRQGRSTWASPQQAELWPKGLIAYEFSAEFSDDQRRLVEDAIADLQKDTCIRFRRWRPWTGTGSRIRFRNTKRGCASLVGFQPAMPQTDVFLSFPGCSLRGTIQHELLHVLGFWHEHTRHDRDLYVSVVWRNIAKDRLGNFEARKVEDPRISGLGYDYASVMHYRAHAFSKDKKSQTIVPKEKNALAVMGQREGYSSLDLDKLNRLYKCA